MTLPSSGPISLAQVNTELGKSSTAPISLNDAAVRSLAGKPSGPISMADLRGKSASSREPPTGTNYNYANFNWVVYLSDWWIEIYWNGVLVYDAASSDAPTLSSVKVGEWTYYRGALAGSVSGERYYGLYRDK